MFVPAILVVPAVISGLSIWNHWGLHWLMLSLAATTAVLALLVNARRALLCALVGALVGLVTSPLLLLFTQWNWSSFGWWMAATTLAPALIVPLLWGYSPPRVPLTAVTPGEGALSDASPRAQSSPAAQNLTKSTG
jgi:hypothetical protein